jgi:agmatinase
VQVDAHIDWRDEIDGVTHGFSSTMRRASEMAHVEGIVQIGARGVGSARAGEVAAAEAWGARMFSMRLVHSNGLAPALAAVPQGADVILTIDVDGLDPALCPGVLATAFGGLGYQQMLDLIEGVAARNTIIGATMVEYVPDCDPSGLGAQAAARLLCNVIATLTRSASP